MIDDKLSHFSDTTRKTFTAHHIRMYPMFNSSKNSNTCINGISTRLHHRRIRNAIKNTKASSVENLEFQRSLSFASPGGFLFRLKKDDGVKSLTQRDPPKITLQGKRISSGQKEGDFFRSRVGQPDVSSIIRQSILQRSKLALRSASNFKDLRIEGETTFLLKAEKNPQNHGMDKPPVSLKPRKGNVEILPPLAKHRAHDKSQKQKRITELKDTSLSLDGNQIMPAAKQDVSVENKMENKVSRRAHRVADKTKYDKNHGFICFGSEEMITDRTRRKRTITVFLPVFSTDEQY